MGMRFAVLVLSFSGALSQCTSYYTNVASACDLANSNNTDMTRFCNGACNTALNTASTGCSASVTSEAQYKTMTDTYLSYCSACMQAYTRACIHSPSETHAQAFQTSKRNPLHGLTASICGTCPCCCAPS